ncbi:MAG: CDP-alcohol phosphatidyltransferase family protein [Chloroflexota bacterium]
MTMLDRDIRVYKEKVLNPVAEAINGGIHPTTITLLSGVFGIAAAIAAWQQMYWLGLGFWVVNRILDGLDGTVARLTNQQSDLGGYIDIMVDDVVYSVVVLAFGAGINTPAAWLATAFLLATYRINATSWMYLSSLLEKRAEGAKNNDEFTSVTMPTGLIEGTETVIFYILFYLLPGFITPLFWLFGLLVTVTAIQRVVWATKVFR